MFMYVYMLSALKKKQSTCYDLQSNIETVFSFVFDSNGKAHTHTSLHLYIYDKCMYVSCVVINIYTTVHNV